MNPEFQSIVERLEKVEKQNRRMKRAGLAVLLGCVGILTMGRARPSHTVEADRFLVRDSAGRIRVEIADSPTGPALRFLSSDGKEQASLSGAELSVSGPSTASGRPTLVLTGIGLTLLDTKGNEISLGGVLNPDRPELAPGIFVADAQGFKAALGVGSLVTTETDETHTTSAASLRLFGKDGKVFWSTP